MSFFSDDFATNNSCCASDCLGLPSGNSGLPSGNSGEGGKPASLQISESVYDLIKKLSYKCISEINIL